jgi:hypothetical protein
MSSSYQFLHKIFFLKFLKIFDSIKFCSKLIFHNKRLFWHDEFIFSEYLYSLMGNKLQFSLERKTFSLSDLVQSRGTKNPVKGMFCFSRMISKLIEINIYLI